jgi:hypothetical protein
MEEENAARRAIRMRLKDPENYAIYRADRIKRAERMENEEIKKFNHYVGFEFVLNC